MVEDGPSILIVDDNRAALTGLERDLAPLGARLMTLQDGHQLLDRVRADKPDVVLLDALLPGLSGFDLCKQIKTTPDLKNTLVVILTGVYVKEQYREDAINQFKADGFLTKPCRPTELQRQMLRLLAKKYKTTPADLQRALKGKGKEVLVVPQPVSPAPAPKRGWLDRLLGRKLESEAISSKGEVLEAPSDPPDESEAAVEETPETEVPDSTPEGQNGSSEPPLPPVEVERASEPAPAAASVEAPPVEEVLYVAEEPPPPEADVREVTTSAPAKEVEESVPANAILFSHESAALAPDLDSDVSESPSSITQGLPPVEAILAEPVNGPAPAEDVWGETLPETTLFASLPAVTPGLPVFPESAFFHELKRELRRSHRSGKPLTLMLIRVDDLGQIVELFGQETKQRVLSHVAEVAVETAREVDMAGIVLSLELVGLAAFACDRYGGGRISARILKANLRRPFSVGEAIPAIIPALKFGMATYPTDTQELEGLLARARDELAVSS